MKRIIVIFRMSKDHSRPSDDYPHNIETVDACITLPMPDDMVADILGNQAESRYIRAMTGKENVLDVLLCIAAINGYTSAAFCGAVADE